MPRLPLSALAPLAPAVRVYFDWDAALASDPEVELLLSEGLPSPSLLTPWYVRDDLSAPSSFQDPLARTLTLAEVLSSSHLVEPKHTLRIEALAASYMAYSSPPEVLVVTMDLPHRDSALVLGGNPRLAAALLAARPVLLVEFRLPFSLAATDATHPSLAPLPRQASPSHAPVRA